MALLALTGLATWHSSAFGSLRLYFLTEAGQQFDGHWVPFCFFDCPNRRCVPSDLEYLVPRKGRALKEWLSNKPFIISSGTRPNMKSVCGLPSIRKVEIAGPGPGAASPGPCRPWILQPYPRVSLDAHWQCTQGEPQGQAQAPPSSLNIDILAPGTQ